MSDRVAQPQFGSRPTLTLDDYKNLAARVATIIRAPVPADTYKPAIEQSWNSVPSSCGIEEFEKLIRWAAERTAKRNDIYGWFDRFRSYIQDGITNSVWEKEPPVPVPVLKKQATRPKAPSTNQVSTPRMGVAGIQEASENVEVVADPVNRPWGSGSLRLGPRWTTGKKSQDYYNYADVKFDDSDN